MSVIPFQLTLMCQDPNILCNDVVIVVWVLSKKNRNGHLKKYTCIYFGYILLTFTYIVYFGFMYFSTKFVYKVVDLSNSTQVHLICGSKNLWQL